MVNYTARGVSNGQSVLQFYIKTLGNGVIPILEVWVTTVLFFQHILKVAACEAKVWNVKMSLKNVTPAQRKYIHQRVSMIIF